MTARIALALLFAVSASFAAAPAQCGDEATAAAGEVKEYDIELVRARADEMSARLLDAYYETDAYGAESRLAELMGEYPDLADPELARFVFGLSKRETNPRAKKQLDYLFFDIASTVVYEDLAALEDSIIDTESGGTVVVDSEQIAYRDLGLRLYNEEDSEKRERYYLAMGDFEAEETNPLREELLRELRRELREFGFEDLEEFESKRRGIDFDAFDETVTAFLTETGDIYRTLTNDAAMEVFGVPAPELKDYERGRIFRGAEFDEYFPADRMMPLLESVLAGMGIHLNELEAIKIDSEDRPEKEPRAATYGVRPGEDVRVLVKPAGGATDYEGLFHEMGHALHDAFVAVPEYEFQRLGDYGVTETYAFLLEGLFTDDRFLEAHGIIGDPEKRSRFLKGQLMSELGSARYYSALFKYERLLHSGSLESEGLIDAYAALMEQARLVPLEHPEFGYLSSNEDFYGVNYLEAWLLCAQLRAVLTERFGAEWWASEDAGRFLVKLWAYGAEKTSQEVAQLLGYDRLDSTLIIRELRAAFERHGG